MTPADPASDPGPGPDPARDLVDGQLDGLLDVDDRTAGWVRQGALDGRPLVILAHGAGAPFTSPFCQATADGLVERGFAVVRFHFPYMQRRVDEGGRRPPDRMPVLLATWAEMLRVAAGWKGAGPLILAGKSMGGRVAAMLLADGEPGDARGVVYLGYPLHPPGKPESLRSEHLPRVAVPQLFLSGTKDSLARLELLEPLVAGLPGARLQLIEGGDHSLAARRSQPLEHAGAWLDAMAAFIAEVTWRRQSPADRRGRSGAGGKG